MITVMLAICTLIILSRCVCAASKLNRREWDGHAMRFAGIAGAYAAVAGGALGTLMAWQYGPATLMLGVAGWILFDRRYVGKGGM